MPADPRRARDEDLEDDDDGSKAEDGDYEDVKEFDDNDLAPVPTTKASPVRPQHDRKRLAPGTSSIHHHLNLNDTDTIETLNNVSGIVNIPWPAAAGKRPPRDMKRLKEDQWYVVCKVMKWGDTPALFVRSTVSPNEDYGFYKPPTQFYSYHFQVGDRLQLSQVGYSLSRNRVATNIRIKATHLFPIPEFKQQWSAPPFPEGTAAPSDSKAKKKVKTSGGQDMSLFNKKKAKEIVHNQPQQYAPLHHQHSLQGGMIPGLMMHSDQSSMGDLTQLGSFQVAHGKKKDNNNNSSAMAYMFPSFTQGSATGLPSQQHGPISTGSFFFASHTPDITRVPSFGNFMGAGNMNMSMSDFFAASSGGLIPPPSPNILGSSSPLIGGPQPTIHRIASAGGFGSFSSMSSPSTNGPPFSFSFPSTSNMTFNNSGDQISGS